MTANTPCSVMVRVANRSPKRIAVFVPELIEQERHGVELAAEGADDGYVEVISASRLRRASHRALRNGLQIIAQSWYGHQVCEDDRRDHPGCL